MFLQKPPPPVKPWPVGTGKTPDAGSFKGKCIAITGMGGFIGLRMMERALEMGMRVKGLDCSPAAVRRAEEKGREISTRLKLPQDYVQVMQGDVTNSNDTAELCKGSDIIFHTAAVVLEDGKMEFFRKVNVEGSRNMCSSAKAAGASVFLHLSSVMVYGFNYPPNVTEEGPFRGENNPYCQTKIESEAAVLEFQDKGRFDVVIIRPGDVYGIGSIPWIDRPLEVIQKGAFALPSWGKSVLNHVHVDNLLDGVLLAAQQTTLSSGQAFVFTDDPPDESPTTCAQFFSYHYRWANRPKMLVLPTFLMIGILFVMQIVNRLLGRPSIGSPTATYFLDRPHKYSCNKARKVLGYYPRITLEQGMAQVESHLRKTGKLPK
eukprot:TRINITY_DN3241_c0_g1_i1.p1 TRINITY_DN3241_c0_g1~~TRINITY_DN3241_c0_g1_i1.p1  ORF type:complete len:375 (+),score=80.54 TRINITY_DN3241_c0_g1_i1:63-1187(+)